MPTTKESQNVARARTAGKEAVASVITVEDRAQDRAATHEALAQGGRGSDQGDRDPGEVVRAENGRAVRVPVEIAARAQVAREVREGREGPVGPMIAARAAMTVAPAAMIGATTSRPLNLHRCESIFCPNPPP
jgi:hypothetical protein